LPFSPRKAVSANSLVRRSALPSALALVQSQQSF
jgi:hypothetical protein